MLHMATTCHINQVHKPLYQPSVEYEHADVSTAEFYEIIFIFIIRTKYSCFYH
ncbi:hypothetical protein T01_958 [Trichinella spiralis]|uniref:Uncharacterized protein n=1 Tax=Trichinella spiralis TaxID=6334 RepID=A0A0V0Z0K7_TRISP|nr:hypothetical protein T01_958 [Trichinella spiralis]